MPKYFDKYWQDTNRFCNGEIFIHNLLQPLLLFMFEMYCSKLLWHSFVMQTKKGKKYYWKLEIQTNKVFCCILDHWMVRHLLLKKS